MATYQLSNTGTLELKRDSGRYLRHYLCGRAVHCGTVLEIKTGPLGMMDWEFGRYECRLTREDSTPYLHLGDDKVIEVGPDDELRWPRRQ